MKFLDWSKSSLRATACALALALGCSGTGSDESNPDSGEDEGGGTGGTAQGSGGQSSSCPPEYELCGATCVRTTDNSSNCGACGVACSAGSSCEGSACVCDVGFSDCGGTCRDTASDPENCGGCGVSCAEGEVCSLGTCSSSCAEGLLECSRACVDVQSDSLNCGACGESCTGGRACTEGSCACSSSSATFCEAAGTCVELGSDPANCGACGNTCASGMCSSGVCAPPATGSGGAGSGSGGTSSGSGGAGNAGQCDAGSATTEWATSCRTTRQTCTSGNWVARPQGSNNHPLRYESEHFAVYWHSSAPGHDGLLGLANPPSEATVRAALDRLEDIWNNYFGAPMFFPEPYCNSTTKTKAAVHLDDLYPLWGGSWGQGYMGLWVGVGALNDRWGLAHEFMHGVQTTTQAFPDCGGNGCWIFESHANWAPHQIMRSDVHCSEMLVNAPHLYYGSTRNRYCNWQFFEYLKDKHCYSAVNEMWSHQAPNGQRDPWQKLMLSRGWNIEQLNDLFGEWATHNITWDYKNPPPTSGNDQGTVYRQAYGSLIDDPGGRTARRNRLTRLESLDSNWAQNRRFVSPFYGAPQRWGYNVVRLFPEAGSDTVTVKFRGVVQSGANTGFRWGLVATNANLTTARYSELKRGTDGELSFCITPGEQVFLVVVATPTQYQKIVWSNPSDGTPYPSIYRYPYLVEVQGAWPQGFQNGAVEACPSGTQRHSNGGGCAPSSTPASVYVGPYARILGGSVTGNARIEDQATIINGTVNGNARVGALTLLGVASAPGQGASNFTVRDNAIVQSTFYPMGWFGSGKAASGTARLLGDLEYYSNNKTSNTFYGMVDDNWNGVSSVTEVTEPPPYSWRP